MSWNGLQTANYFHRSLAIWHYSFNLGFFFSHSVLLISPFRFLSTVSLMRTHWLLDNIQLQQNSQTKIYKQVSTTRKQSLLYIGSDHFWYRELDEHDRQIKCFWKLLKRLHIPSLYQVWRHSRDWLVHSCQLSLDLSWAMTCIILNKID